MVQLRMKIWIRGLVAKLQNKACWLQTWASGFQYIKFMPTCLVFKGFENRVTSSAMELEDSTLAFGEGRTITKFFS